MYIKKFSIRNSGDFKVYICRSVKGKKTRQVLERYPSYEQLKKEHGDADLFLKERMEELSKNADLKREELISLTVDPNETFGEKEEYQGIRNAGYLFLQKAYYDLGIDSFINSWKHTKGWQTQYSLPDAFRFLVYSRVIDPCSKLAVSKKGGDYLESFHLSDDDLYDSLDRIDDFSAALTRKLSNKCRNEIAQNSDVIYYDCTNFYFEIQYPDVPEGLRDYGVEKNHRPDPIVEYGLLLSGNGYPVGQCVFRGNESEKTSLLPLLSDAGEDISKATIICADNGLNTEGNKKVIHESGRNYIFVQSPKQLREADLSEMFREEGYRVYDGGRKKVKSYWIKRTNGREERLVVRFDQASADFVNRTIDRRVERAKKFLKNPSLLSYRNCQDGKEYVKKAVFDDRTGEVIEARSVLELDEEKIAEERKTAGYMLYVTDIPREQDDLDGEFGKLKRLGYRVEYMDDREIVEIAGKRNDIEDCFRQMKSGLEARPVFVRKPEHIQAHLFTVYTALVLLMYLKKKYSLETTNGTLLEDLRRYGVLEMDKKGDVSRTGYYSPGIDELRRKTGLPYVNRRYLTRPMLKAMIAKSKGK